MTGTVPITNAAAAAAAAVPAERPRIAFFPVEYDEVRTGPGTFAQYLRRETERGRFDMVFFADEMAACRAPHERPVRLPVRLPSPPGQFVRQMAWHRAFLEEHRRNPFDVLWFNSSNLAWVAVKSRRVAPIVAMVNDYSNAMTTDWRETMRIAGAYRTATRFFWMLIERSALRGADLVVVNSAYLREEIIRRYRLDPARVTVLYKGVDLDLFKPSSDRRPLDPALVRILFVKNDYVRGGFDDVVRALARAPFRTVLTVAGPPAEWHDRIRAAAARAGYRGELRLLGRVPRARIPELYRDADVYCVPSRVEALGVAFMEALASGVPVIGSSVGGIPEVLDDGRAGWLAEPFDSAGVLRALREIVDEPEERARRVAHGLRHVRRFDVEHSLTAFEALAGAVARGRPVMPEAQ